MRRFSVIISAILLLQLSSGVLSEEKGCTSIAEKKFPTNLVQYPYIILDSATQEDIDNLHNMVEGDINAWDCYYAIKMNGNTKVSNLHLPPFVIGLEITNNPSLSTIAIPTKVENGITVTRNNKLNSNVQQLEDLRKLCKGKMCDIQENNECWFEESVSDPADLEHCSKIRTDLEIEEMNAEVPTKFTEIKCLSLAYTNVTNLDFLKDLTKDNVKCDSARNMVLKYNKKLCWSHTKAKTEISKLNDKFIIYSNYHNGCTEPLECLYEDAVEAVQASEFHSCNVITGDTTIECSTTTRIKFKQYKKLSGALTLTKCSSEQAIERIKYFQEIDAGVAVTLKDPTDNLEKFAKGNFKEISLKGQTILKVDSKNQFSFIKATKIRNTFVRSGETDVVFTNVEPEPTGEGVCVVSKKETSLPEGCTIVYGDLFLGENTENVNPDLKEVKGCLQIFKANKVTNYDFLKNLEVGKKCIYFKGSSEVTKTDCIPLDVRQSIKGLLYDSIMDPLNGNNAQCECFYKNPVTEINENCKLIDGDLIVNENTQTIPSGIEEVTGCIRISKETTIDLSFLKTIKTFSHSCLYRKDKSGIDVECVPYSLLSSITIPSIREPPREECGECKPEKVEDFDPKCKIVIGNLLIKGVENGDVEENMKNVEEIYGVVIIKRNRADKIEFPKLKQIVVTGSSDPALKIYNNKKLVSVELPSLETISVNGSTTGRKLIHIEKNPKWKASKTMQEKVKALTGSDCSDVEGSGCFQKPVEQTSRDLSPTNQLSVSDKIGICLMVTTTIMAISFFLACGLWTFLLCKTDF